MIVFLALLTVPAAFAGVSTFVLVAVYIRSGYAQAIKMQGMLTALRSTKDVCMIIDEVGWFLKTHRGWRNKTCSSFHVILYVEHKKGCFFNFDLRKRRRRKCIWQTNTWSKAKVYRTCRTNIFVTSLIHICNENKFRKMKIENKSWKNKNPESENRRTKCENIEHFYISDV